MRRCARAFAPQGSSRSTRALGCGLATCRCTMAACIVTRSALASSCGGLALARRGQIHTRAPGLGQTYRNRLLGGARSMFALTDVIHLLFDEFTCLRAGSLALALVPFCPLHCLSFWHGCLLT